jgi:flagellar basal-body rod protein FlgG
MSDTINAIARSLSADVATLGTISHNVANLGTNGFRAQRLVPTFQAQVGDGAPANAPSATDTASAIAIDLGDGPQVETGRPLDIALRGPGFFEVQRDGEVLLARAGDLRRDADGRLVTARGDAVLVGAGELVLGKENVRIDKRGELFDGDESLGQLHLVQVADPAALVALEGGVFRHAGERVEWTGAVRQGALERANVDAAEESIRLMELTRHVESVQRALSIYDKAMDNGINRIGEN